ncbi:MAG TPA: M23 family metallopeptidase, partial [Terracidiphilus sp.]|nr:M23 family metallopeptidase [Terracidiphilus sp.]
RAPVTQKFDCDTVRSTLFASRYAGRMGRIRLFLVFVLVSLFAPRAEPTQVANQAVVLTPREVVAGSPELISVRAAADSVDGEWLGRKIQFFQSSDHRSWLALAGADVETPAGPSRISITLHTPDRGNVDISETIDIRPAHYRTGTLTVAPQFVQPPPEALKEIEEEGKLKAKVFAASASDPLWRSSFHAPVPAQATDSFGTRRMFNGKLASIHKGADFHAATGTPVHASNSGVVVLARHLYFEGNCVIIDHGLGLYTLSMHFSRIDVQEGQHVNAGDRLGLSGATGRVTGPHLHWAVRWQGAYLDPVKLLKLDLNSVR